MVVDAAVAEDNIDDAGIVDVDDVATVLNVDVPLAVYGNDKVDFRLFANLMQLLVKFLIILTFCILMM